MDANPRELAENFDLEHLTAEFYADPYPTYRALREHAPVKRLANGSFFLTRYDDLVRAYKTTRSFSSDKKREFLPKFGETPLYAHHTTSLVFNDPPAHTRVRRLITGALSPRAIAGMEPDLVALVDSLLDAIEANGRCELVEDFAAAIPIEVIGNLLDVPREERAPLRGWSMAILGALEPVLSTEALARGNQAVTEFLAYLETLVARRRATPGNPERDVLTRLIQGEGQGDDDGERLTELELLHNCIFLLNAGHETTTNLIGNGLVALAAASSRATTADRPPGADQDRDRGVSPLREFEPARQPHDHGAGRPRRRCAACGRLSDAVHRRSQPRPPAFQRSRPARYRPHPEPSSGVCHRRASMRRRGAGAARRRDRDLAIPQAVSRLCLERCADPRRQGALPRIFARALRDLIVNLSGTWR